MLPGGYSAVLKAKDRDEFRDEIVRFAHQLGFDTVAAVTVVERGVAGTEFISVDNTPQEFVSIFRDTVLMRRDPVMQHCRKQSVPIIWDQQTYTGQGLGELWEEQAQFGFNTGIAMALHLPEGRHFVLGVDRDKPLPADAAPKEYQFVQSTQASTGLGWKSMDPMESIFSSSPVSDRWTVNCG